MLPIFTCLPKNNILTVRIIWRHILIGNHVIFVGNLLLLNFLKCRENFDETINNMTL